MIFFGHLGITMAAVRTADKALIPRGRFIDYRIVLLGSLMPDLLDKGILFFMSDERFRSGRMFAHSLLFSMILLTVGVIVRLSYRKTWALLLAVCSFIHQLLDQMWNQLNVFLWPFYDTANFVTHRNNGTWTEAAQNLHVIPLNHVVLLNNNNSQTLWRTVKKVMSNPGYSIPEIVGLLILFCFLISLIRKRMLINFLRTGRLSKNE